MDQLPPLLPFGGSAAIAVYLLWMVVQERNSWRIDRRALVDEHRQDVADTEARFRTELAERQQYAVQLRERIADLETEIRQLRLEIRQLRDEMHPKADGL